MVACCRLDTSENTKLSEGYTKLYELRSSELGLLLKAFARGLLRSLYVSHSSYDDDTITMTLMTTAILIIITE